MRITSAKILETFIITLNQIKRQKVDLKEIQQKESTLLVQTFVGRKFREEKKNAKFWGLTFANSRLQPISRKINFCESHISHKKKTYIRNKKKLIQRDLTQLSFVVHINE